MIFRQLIDSASSTYTYLLADEATSQALLIDPVFEQFERDAALLRELGLTLRYTIETHVHADHVTAAWLFQQRLGSQILVAEAAGAEGADRLLRPGEELALGAVRLQVRATPGHTNGCITLVTADHTLALTGDSLMIRAAGRTDFQQGDAARLYRSVHEQIFTLPDACLIYPGHDYKGRTVSSVAEEKAYNPRLGGQTSVEDFVGFMSNLGLPHPKQIEVAVPANLRCGRTERGAAPAAPTWAPVVRTYAGIWQIDPEWLAEHRLEVLIIDVREPAEFTGELGHVEGAQLLPIGQLQSRLQSLPRERPVVTVCRSGSRSAQAAVILEGAGFDRVANLAGGMLRWRAAR